MVEDDSSTLKINESREESKFLLEDEYIPPSTVKRYHIEPKEFTGRGKAVDIDEKYNMKICPEGITALKMIAQRRRDLQMGKNTDSSQESTKQISFSNIIQFERKSLDSVTSLHV